MHPAVDVRRSTSIGAGPSGLGPGRVLAVLLITALALSGCGSGGSQYPSFFAEEDPQPDVDAALVGTMAKPALQIEGLAVKVETDAFHVVVTVSGPVVPGEGLPDQPEATTCTWTVTMKDADRRRAGLGRRLPLRRPSRFGLPDGPRPGRAPSAARASPRPDPHVPAAGIRARRRGDDAVGSRPQTRGGLLGLHGRKRLTPFGCEWGSAG